MRLRFRLAIRGLIFFILIFLIGACSSDSPIDCSEISIQDCESKGCALLTGTPYDTDELCRQAAIPYQCTSHSQCDDVLTIGIKDGECARFDNACLPEGWSESDPDRGDCNLQEVDAPLCDETPKCEDLSIAECLAPRCKTIDGQLFVPTVGGTNNAGCFEAREPLGCEPITSNSNDSPTGSSHDGSCYLFMGENLPKGWVVSSDCPNLNGTACE